MQQNVVWQSANGKYRLIKKSDRFFLFYIDWCEVSIWKECDNDDIFITGMDISDVPKYVKKALEKHVGDIFY